MWCRQTAKIIRIIPKYYKIVFKNWWWWTAKITMNTFHKYWEKNRIFAGPWRCVSWWIASQPGRQLEIFQNNIQVVVLDSQLHKKYSKIDSQQEEVTKVTLLLLKTPLKWMNEHKEQEKNNMSLLSHQAGSCICPVSMIIENGWKWTHASMIMPEGWKEYLDVGQIKRRSWFGIMRSKLQFAPGFVFCFYVYFSKAHPWNMRYSARIKHQRNTANMGTSKPHSSRKIKSLVDLEKKLTSSPHHPSNIYEARFNPRAMICSLDLGSFDYTSPPLPTNPPSPHDSYPNLNCNQVSYFPFILKEKCYDIPWLNKF